VPKNSKYNSSKIITTLKENQISIDDLSKTLGIEKVRFITGITSMAVCNSNTSKD
jgi:hypothetical protein